MNCTTQVAVAINSESTCALHICCALQILVIDRQNGPADIFMDIVGKLADRDLCITTATGPNDAKRALNQAAFDLVVVGMDNSQPALLDLIPSIRMQSPESPVVVIGDRSTPDCIECIENLGAREYIPLPARAAALKSVVRHIEASYFRTA